jgi:hypothetical protein
MPAFHLFFPLSSLFFFLRTIDQENGPFPCPSWAQPDTFEPFSKLLQAKENHHSGAKGSKHKTATVDINGCS